MSDYDLENYEWPHPLVDADWSLIPDHMRAALRRYIALGIPPGSFLEAVLSNDLKNAFGRADDENRRRLFEWVRFLYNYAPTGCWGSPDTVKDWIKSGGIEGQRARETSAA